jgi:hypothetical protein
VCGTNLWNILGKLKVCFELRVVARRLYEDVIFKFRNSECWSQEINCNIRVKQGCPMSPTHFGAYILTS